MDQEGVTYYVYCKTLYEEITEELLISNNDTHKIKAKKEVMASAVVLPLEPASTHVSA